MPEAMPDDFATDLQDQIDDLIIQYGKPAVLAAVHASDRKSPGRPRIKDAPHLIAMAMILESDPGLSRWEIARKMAHGIKGRPDESEARRLYTKFKKNERYYRRHARKIEIRAKLRDSIYNATLFLLTYRLRIQSRLNDNTVDPTKTGERVDLQRRISVTDHGLETLKKLEAYVFNRTPN